MPTIVQRTARAKPGERGRGQFYRVVVRPKAQFSAFRIQQVGRPGHTERLAGKRPGGTWDTQAWLISKQDAHIEKNRLKIDDRKARTVLKQVREPIVHKHGDIFEAKPRPNVPEYAKPTAAQRRARKANIKKSPGSKARKEEIIKSRYIR